MTSTKGLTLQFLDITISGDNALIVWVLIWLSAHDSATEFLRLPPQLLIQRLKTAVRIRISHNKCSVTEK